MSDSGSVSGGGEATRVKGETIVKAIVYGNNSQHFGKKREPDGHTHEWTVYVKPYNNEDMSSYVKKVQFRLHESYNNCNRVVSKPPYEVSETGWGEFEIQIKIFFQDSAEKPVILYHVLRLFHNQPGEPVAQPTSSAVVQGRKTVVSEFYDEIIFQVSRNFSLSRQATLRHQRYKLSPLHLSSGIFCIFQDPTQYMHTLLTTTRPLTLSAYKHTTDFEERRSKNLAAVTEARKKVQAEIVDLKDKVKIAKETIVKFKAEIMKCQQDESDDFSSAQSGFI